MSKHELKKINDAWLHLDDELSYKNLFNPFDMVSFNDDDYHLKVTWLMSRPEYFSFLCKHILI